MSIVAVVGLGYVGLPLAVEFGKKIETIGLDLSKAKIESYKRFCDPTGEMSGDDLRAALHFLFKRQNPLVGGDERVGQQDQNGVSAIFWQT